MKGRRLRIAIAICSGLLLVAGIPIVFLHSANPLAARVDAILLLDMMPGKTNWNGGMNKLWALGPGVTDRLAQDARLQDSLWSRKYEKLWEHLPASVKARVPKPINRAELRQTAMHAISEFGPLAVRRSAPEVIAGLSSSDDPWNPNYYAVMSVGWLIPESPRALAVFEHGLSGADSNWPPPETFLGVWDDKIWSKIPGIVPLLTNGLGDTGNAYLNAIALGWVGSNAAPAIPALIQTADMGAAGPFTNAEAARVHMGRVFSNPAGWHMAKLLEDDKGMNHNRAMALQALGRIGVATPEVRAALVRGWNNSNAWVRQNAAISVALLGPPMTNELEGLLTGLMDPDNAPLGAKLRAIRKIGPDARALDALHQLAQTNRIQNLVADPQARVVGQAFEDLALSAKMDICQIDPREGINYLPEIADKIGWSWDSVEFLLDPGPLSNDVVRVVEPLLQEAGSTRQSLAAYVILHHDKQHAGALAVLRRNKFAGNLDERLLAGRLLFETIGETNGLCALVAEGFASPNSFTGQVAGHIADEMGDAALPDLPVFKGALWHQDMFVRQQAGNLVLKLAPEELPIAGVK